MMVKSTLAILTVIFLYGSLAGAAQVSCLTRVCLGQAWTCRVPTDLAIVLETSYTTLSQWQEMKTYTKNLVDNFEISENGTHVSIMTFNTRTNIVTKFNTYNRNQWNAATIKRDIDNLKWSSGSRSLYKAVKATKDHIFTKQAGMRVNASKLCVFVATGKEDVHLGDFLVPRNELTNKLGVKIFSVLVDTSRQLINSDYSNLDKLTTLLVPFLLTYFREKKTLMNHIKINHCRDPVCFRSTDLAIILESSNKTKSMWDGMKTFAKDLVDSYDISDSATRVSVMSYSAQANIVTTFNKYTGNQLNAANIKRDIDGLQWTAYGGSLKTFLNKAVQATNGQIFTTQAGMRSNVSKYGVFLTTNYYDRVYNKVAIVLKPFDQSTHLIPNKYGLQPIFYLKPYITGTWNAINIVDGYLCVGPSI